MITLNDAQTVKDSTLYDSDGDKIGKIGQVYLSDTTGEPEFATVNTGLFGTNESFVPLAAATLTDDGVSVPFTKDQVKGAPNVSEDGHLEPHEEDALYEYYGLGRGTSQSDQPSAAGDDAVAGMTTDAGVSSEATYASGAAYPDAASTDAAYASAAGSEGHDTSGPDTDEAMTRSEEQLEVGTRSQVAGRARLRKYVTTEEQTVTVPVSKEYAVLETEPITEANAGSALSGGDITEEEHEVLLNEEVVEVNKTVTPVERVRLATETRTEDQTVTEEVRKENIEVEGEVEDRS